MLAHLSTNVVDPNFPLADIETLVCFLLGLVFFGVVAMIWIGCYLEERAREKQERYEREKRFR